MNGGVIPRLRIRADCGVACTGILGCAVAAFAAAVVIASTSEARADGDEAKVTRIATQHEFHLDNGRVLRGDLVSAAQADPLEIRIGGIGVLRLPRSRVTEVVERTGAITWSNPARAPARDGAAEAPAAGSSAPPGEGAGKASAGTASALDSSPQELVRALARRQVAGELAALTSPVAADRALQIAEAVRELGRHRTRNRVRAERALIRYGSDALVPLAALRDHPFALTRRAVQRIIGAWGDPRALPLAIGALDDADEMVRRLAWRVVEGWEAARDLRHSESDRPRRRRDVQAELWRRWGATRVEELLSGLGEAPMASFGEPAGASTRRTHGGG